MAERSEAVEQQTVRDGSAIYLVEANIAPAENVPPGYKRTEVGVVPEDWSVVKLGCAMANIIDFRGRTPKKLGMNWGGGDIPALSARNVKMGKIDFREETYYGSEKLYKRWMTNGHADKGDVVVTMEAPLGNVALIPDHQRYILSQRTILLQPDSSSLLSEFLAQLLSSLWFQKVLQDNGTGSTATGIQRRRFERLDIPCPRITEQRAIATALSDADALIESLDRLIAKKRAIKQAAMQQLLTGQTRLPGFTGEWETKRLGEFVSIRNQKVMPSSVHPDTLCIELEHLGQGDGRLWSQSTAKYSTASKYQFQAGDVLFGRLRSYLRKYWLAKQDGICTTEIWPLSVDVDKAVSGFLMGIVQSDRFNEIASISYGTHMPRADWKVLKNFEVRLPEVEEQIAIATVLSDTDTEIEALERRRDKARQIKQGMMQQLLTGRVRLVPPENREAAVC